MKKISTVTIVESAILILAGIGLVVFLITNNQPTKTISDASKSSVTVLSPSSERTNTEGLGTAAYPPEPVGSMSPWGLKKPSIRILSPGSGETLEAGMTFAIRWTSQGIPERKVDLYLYEYDGLVSNSKNPGKTIAESVSLKDGAYEWVVPKNNGYPKYSIFISDKGDIRIACYSGEGIPKECIMSWNFGTSDFFHIVEKQE